MSTINESKRDGRRTVAPSAILRASSNLQFARILFCWLCAVLGVMSSSAGELDGVQQLIVSVAPSWNSTTGTLQRYEREGRSWRAVGEPWAVLYGRNGLAWGRGLRGQEEAGVHKSERDGCAPAGLFALGKIYTYDRALPEGSDFPFHTVGPGDAWIDDPKHPDYNRHVVVDPKNPPVWFAKQRMRHGDFAYRWLVEIRHNSDPPVAGAGSAIFFIRWLRADAKPRYVLLPASEYPAKAKAWGLPQR
jgi:L,D-peptidoglycan transpeptidase YkuD (ErfK/YbiS/YcfS/YnhG family)